MVVVRQDEGTGKRLVGYVVGKGDLRPRSKELAAYLESRVPEYMVPSAFLPLEKMPLMPNGKLDRRALPAPDQSRPDLERVYAAPGTTTEGALAEIWSEVLGMDQVGIHDNFFELGGHSLLATQVLTRVREAFQVELSLRRFFEAPTIAELAAAVEEALIQEIKELSNAEAGRLVEERELLAKEGP